MLKLKYLVGEVLKFPLMLKLKNTEYNIYNQAVCLDKSCKTQLRLKILARPER